MERQFYDEWEGFKPGRWSNTSINLRDFIQKNFTPYDGDDSFLTGPTEATLGTGNGAFKEGERSRRCSRYGH